MSDSVQEKNWEGISENEHRTVGPNRAWCYTDAEWCYPMWNRDGAVIPEMLCHCCDQTKVPQRWRGDNVTTILSEIRAEVVALQTQHYHSNGAHWAFGKVLEILDGGVES